MDRESVSDEEIYTINILYKHFSYICYYAELFIIEKKFISRLMSNNEDTRKLAYSGIHNSIYNVIRNESKDFDQDDMYRKIFDEYTDMIFIDYNLYGNDIISLHDARIQYVNRKQLRDVILGDVLRTCFLLNNPPNKEYCKELILFINDLLDKKVKPRNVCFILYHMLAELQKNKIL